MTARRILIADDSIVFRRFLRDILLSDPRVEVVGEAADGHQTLALARELRPAVLTLDVDMPHLGGIEVLDALLKFDPRPTVIMVSRMTDADSRTTLAALCRGAADFIVKPPNLDEPEARHQFQKLLLGKINALAGDPPRESPAPSPKNPVDNKPRDPRVVLVGTSTGGPNALSTLLRGIRPDFPLPILIVQHMPPLFTPLLAERLSSETPWQVQEARERVVPRPGEVWIAPGDRHLTVAGEGKRWFLHLTEDPPENFCRPSVDALFRTAAKTLNGHALGVILTGMGQDGTQGAGVLRQAGGAVLAQDRESSLIWGMPGSVVKAGEANEVVPLDRLAGRLHAWAGAVPGSASRGS